MKKLILGFFVFFFFGTQNIFCSSGDFVRSIGVLQQRMMLASGLAKQQHLLEYLKFIVNHKPGPGSAIAQATYYKNASWSWEKSLFAPTKLAFAAIKSTGTNLSENADFVELVRDVLSIFDTHEEIEVIENIAESSTPPPSSSSYHSLDLCETLRTDAEVARTSVGRFKPSSSLDCCDELLERPDDLDLSAHAHECVSKVAPSGKFFGAAKKVMSATRVVKRMQRKTTGREEKDAEAFDQAIKWALSFSIPAAALGRPVSDGSGDTSPKGSVTLRAIATFEEESDELLREALRLVDSIKALIEAERGEKDSLARLRSFEDSVVPTIATIKMAMEARLNMFKMRMAAIQAEFENLQRVMFDIARGSEHDLSGFLVV